MGTSAKITLKDNTGELYFYRASDGYFESIKNSLTAFIAEVNRGALRKTILQSSVALIYEGIKEHEEFLRKMTDEERQFYHECTQGKVGFYSSCLEDTVTNLTYLIDLREEVVTIKQL